MIIIYEILKIVVGLLIGFMLGSYLPSYFKQKGKNLATVEDIGKITRLQEEVKNIFHSSLEEQKSELNAKLEELKHQQNKLLKDYELYTVKRFEYYPEFYKEIQWSISNVKSLRGMRTTIDFGKLSKTEIDTFMKEKQFMETEKNQILAYWDDDIESAKNILDSRLKKIEYNEAQQSYFDANNFYLLNKMFFSNSVTKIGEELLTKIFKLLTNYDPYLTITNVREMNEENKELLKEIKSLEAGLFSQMKADLSKSNKQKELVSSS